MGIFSTSSPFDADVDKATNENNTTEDWGQIMEICDAVGNSSQKAKDCLRSIVRRLNALDPHIVIQAITLLDACSSNCGKTFHLEIASRDFESEIRKLLLRSQPKIIEKLKVLIKKWAEGDFKTDPQLNLIPTLYNKLKSEGHDFSSLSEMPKHSSASASSAASKEDQDLAKAIEMSLKENKQHSSASHSSPASSKLASLYPSVNLASNSSPPERRKVRALYDFEAAEDNELSFIAGDIIHILDDSDANWWKGAKGKMEGLFPSNFVIADLSVEPDDITKLEQGTKKAVQFAEEVEVKMLKREPEIVEVDINETKIDRLLHLLHEADPQSDTTDPPEMLDLEEQVTAMGPLIDAALEKVDRRHAQLTQLSSDLVDALNLYHTLMREPTITTPYSTLSKMPPHMNVYPYPNQPPQMYNGMMQQQSNYNPVPGLPPGAYHPNMSGMPPEYMNHNMAGMPLPQQYHMPPSPHQHPPPSGHHPGPPGPPVGVPPHSVVTQNHHPGHPVAAARPIQPPGPQLVHQQAPPTQTLPVGHQGHPQTHTQGSTSGTERTSLPYQSQGYAPQVTQIPVQYVPPEIQGVPSNQQPQYAPTSGQRMM
ncbi:signal transducing adapter molecule 2 [Cotesia glomerata]|uniref:Signal transducing adapter molecule 1 n=1 Tax=Cotesia glomerata TaxID=32391 RepID=A0AAV7IBW2_COTGL|nr:signal transducing adapter molecule 2 [Cotesia glomerata]KAH0546873.1 hypothetical protein KQX54_015701 [Cotesia glomerata]